MPICTQTLLKECVRYSTIILQLLPRLCALFLTFTVTVFLSRQILILLARLLHIASFTATQSLREIVRLTWAWLVALANTSMPWSFQTLQPPHTLPVYFFFSPPGILTEFSQAASDIHCWRPKPSSYLPVKCCAAGVAAECCSPSWQRGLTSSHTRFTSGSFSPCIFRALSVQGH